jgi:tetratricopeptide (TPR) repeat protein
VRIGVFVNLRACLLLATTLSSRSLALPAQDESARHLRAGIEEARTAEFSAATADLEAAVATDAGNPEAWYQLGLLRGQIADFPGAESAFRRAINLRPEFAQAHYSLGLTLIADPRGKLDWPAAIAQFREAVKYKPDYAEALNLLGAGLTSTGEIQAAIPELQHALLLKPSLPEAHFNLAIAFEKSGQLQDAEKEYRATLATKSDYPEAATALGKLLFRMGKPIEAEQALVRAIGLNPDMTDAHYTLARVLQSHNETKSAAIEFQIAKDLSERSAAAMQSSQLSNQGLELAAKGDFTGSAESIRSAIRLKPDYGIPHYNLALVLADMGDFSGAARELVKAISLLPGQSKPWLQLGRVLRQQGNNQAALAAFSWTAKLSRDDPATQSELASLQAEMNANPSIAESKLNQEFLRTDSTPDTSQAHLTFAQQLIKQSDFMGAVGELLRSLALEPSLVDARRTLASAYASLGDYPHATLEYYKILATMPQDAEAHLGLGEIYLQGGDPRQAAAEFRMALRTQPDSFRARAGLEKSLKAVSNQ